MSVAKSVPCERLVAFLREMRLEYVYAEER
jgi:hypothetical protein